MSVRFHGDRRPAQELPTFAPHRWAWSIAHGYMKDPGARIHIRHRCGIKRCCNPDHLFPTATNGEEISLNDLEKLRQLTEGRLDNRADRKDRNKLTTTASAVSDCISVSSKKSRTLVEPGVIEIVSSPDSYATDFRDPLLDLLEE
ncbi:HNH endonuclease [Rhodococcus pyridinivorans]